MRQDDSTDYDLYKSCFAACELSTCGSGLCARTDPEINPHDALAIAPSDPSNSTIGTEMEERNMEKRLFLPKRWTRAKAVSYLVQTLVTNRNDPYFGQLQTYFDGTLRTVINQRTFGDQPFQFGTYGLHGCTMLTVISRRAVWQVRSRGMIETETHQTLTFEIKAHFWEIYSTNNDDDINDGGRWDRTVLNPLSGNGPLDPNLPATGGPIDPSLFTGATDEPQAFILAPLQWEVERVNEDATSHLLRDFRYGNKLNRLQTTLDTLIPGIPVQLVAYFALNTLEASDRAKQTTTERGVILFQYDNNYDGTGKMGWRLFNEQNIKQGPSDRADLQ